MSLYECVFIARPDLSAAQVEGLATHFSSVITQGGGKVKKIEHCGLRSLAYRIRKNRKAYYVLMNLDSPASAIHEMERQMRLNEDVMRTLTVVVDKHEDGPSILSLKRAAENASEGSFQERDNRDSSSHHHKEGGYRRHSAAPVDAEIEEPEAIEEEGITR
jgi:small subunit ribosomal protein S6